MGVDWLTCKSCGETFPDCGYMVSCECGQHWCSDDCAKVVGFEEEHCKLGYAMDDNQCGKRCWNCDDLVLRSCNYCREEDFEDETLLDYALSLLGYSREDLIKRYKNSK
jgi:hypothetical protein